MTDHLKTLRELVALPEGYPVAFVEHALRARPALAALLRVVEAAKKVAVWANPGDEVPSPYSDVMAMEANDLRAALRDLEPKEAK